LSTGDQPAGAWPEQGGLGLGGLYSIARRGANSIGELYAHFMAARIQLTYGGEDGRWPG
jgi:hypothetical protein